MQVYHAQHYTTLITDNNKYYYYDGLSLAVPPTVQSLHTHLKTWYKTGSLPNSLRNEYPTITFPTTPSQTDGSTCALHMLITSLSAIYQGNISILQYSQRHVDQLSRMHLRYVLTGEMTPWIDRLITYISNPLQNEDPEPYSKHYSAGGKELADHNLEQNI